LLALYGKLPPSLVPSSLVQVVRVNDFVWPRIKVTMALMVLPALFLRHPARPHLLSLYQ
jgi:hypothetical protein